MMNRLFYLLLLFSLAPLFGYGQNNENNTRQPSFDKLFKSFEESKHLYFGKENDTVDSSSLLRTKDFNLSISEHPITFNTSHVVIKNPYYNGSFDKYDDFRNDYSKKNYPVSYSVIHENKLVSLFENGKFVCHNLVNLQRDVDFENKINTKKFEYHWIINGRLGGRVGNTIYIWDGNKWEKSATEFPLRNQPKLFEDENFIVFNDCHGEWGGTIYFFDKISKETYFTKSTCANSVFKNDRGYFVLAHLGHMIGFSEIKLIENPRELTKAKKSDINRRKEGQALGYQDKSNAYEKTLDLFGIQIFSAFEYGKRQLYIIRVEEVTFLAEIAGSNIQIVHPLFDNDLYTHEPVTTSYGDYTLMNLDFYGTASEREVSVMIFIKDKITKIDWNEDHSR